MKIIPAIDLIDNKCTRLQKGDFKKATTYDISPFEIASEFEKYGAKYLHIIDLDGAKNELNAQSDFVIEIAKKSNLKIQTGGGIKTKEKIKKYLDNSIDKVIIGSYAITKPDLVKEWIDYFGIEKIILAFDIKFEKETPIVYTNAWKNGSISLYEAIENYNPSSRILCTNIDNDGLLKGPDFNLYKNILKKYKNIKLQASGGISSDEDIKNLKDIGIEEVIVGKALYENKIDYKEIFKCWQKE